MGSSVGVVYSAYEFGYVGESRGAYVQTGAAVRGAHKAEDAVVGFPLKAFPGSYHFANVLRYYGSHVDKLQCLHEKTASLVLYHLQRPEKASLGKFLELLEDAFIL